MRILGSTETYYAPRDRCDLNIEAVASLLAAAMFLLLLVAILLVGQDAQAVERPIPGGMRTYFVDGAFLRKMEQGE